MSFAQAVFWLYLWLASSVLSKAQDNSCLHRKVYASLRGDLTVYLSSCDSCCSSANQHITQAWIDHPRRDVHHQGNVFWYDFRDEVDLKNGTHHFSFVYDYNCSDSGVGVCFPATQCVCQEVVQLELRVAYFQLLVDHEFELGSNASLACASGLEDSRDIQVNFTFRSTKNRTPRLGSCNPNQTDASYGEGWIIHRKPYPPHDCVLQIVSVTTDNVGEYQCVGFLPTNVSGKYQGVSSNAVIPDLPLTSAQAIGYPSLNSHQYFDLGILTLLLVMVLVITTFVVVSVCVFVGKKNIRGPNPNPRPDSPNPHPGPGPGPILNPRTDPPNPHPGTGSGPNPIPLPVPPDPHPIPTERTPLLGEPNQKPVSPLQAPAEPVSDSEYRTPPPGDPESPHGKQSSDSDSDKSKVPSVKSFVFLAETNGPEYPSTTSSGDHLSVPDERIHRQYKEVKDMTALVLDKATPNLPPEVPYDRHLTCPYCSKRYKLGQIQYHKRHAIATCPRRPSLDVQGGTGLQPIATGQLPEGTCSSQPVSGESQTQPLATGQVRNTGVEPGGNQQSVNTATGVASPPEVEITNFLASLKENTMEYIDHVEHCPHQQKDPV